MRSDLTREGQEVRETIKKKKIENTHAQKATETCEYEAWLSLVKKKKTLRVQFPRPFSKCKTADSLFSYIRAAIYKTLKPTLVNCFQIIIIKGCTTTQS